MLVASDGEVETAKGLDSVCILDYRSVGHSTGCSHFMVMMMVVAMGTVLKSSVVKFLLDGLHHGPNPSRGNTKAVEFSTSVKT